jgi:hypothetical protein
MPIKECDNKACQKCIQDGVRKLFCKANVPNDDWKVLPDNMLELNKHSDTPDKSKEQVSISNDSLIIK